ncbi:hypothetical protein WJX77_001867 [Trebouxia sp. C0004]
MTALGTDKHPLCDQILPKLYLGPLEAEQVSLDDLRLLGITHVLRLGQREHLGFSPALAMVKAQRPRASPNAGFCEQLKFLEKEQQEGGSGLHSNRQLLQGFFCVERERSCQARNLHSTFKTTT